MNKTHKVSDILNDPSHEAYSATVSMLDDLKSGAISMCACMGAMYGEPFCPCSMKRQGLQHVMDNNPLRQQEKARSAAQWEALLLPGGFMYRLQKENDGL
jgi:hypothetical protein